ARRPGGFLGLAGPVDAVGRTPDVIVSAVLRQIIAAAEDVNLVVESNSTVISAWRPGRPGGGLFPGRTILGGPDVAAQIAIVAEVVFLVAAEDPHLALENDAGRSQARAPTGGFRLLLPGDAVGRGPDLVAG